LAGVELPRLIAIVGPTASGKTDLACSLAERHDGEVVSADSVQIYRYFDIGSGKPTVEERRGIPHHLLDAVAPDEPMDASVFAASATRHIDAILARGRLPIVCGGTFLWMKALLYGLAPAPPKDEAIRERHKQVVEAHGRAALHGRLREVDPAAHARLNPNDTVRVSRALEVYELTGESLTSFQSKHGFSTPRYRVEMVGVEWPAEALKQRIERRVREMLERGWLKEVEDLLARGYAETRPMSSVGYAQVSAALCSSEPLDREALVQAISRVTRIFSRRQRTWLRDRDVRWLAPEHTSGFYLAAGGAE
jgi:tRNA dimethylallyltransferase